MGVTVNGSLITKGETCNSDQQVLPPDELSKIAQAADKLQNGEAAAVAIEKLNNEYGRIRLLLGAVLLKMRENSWNCGYESFEDLCEKRFGITRRAANYHIHIYRWVTEADLGPAIEGIGPGKLRVLASNVAAADAKDWIEKAKDMNCLELAEA